VDRRKLQTIPIVWGSARQDYVPPQHPLHLVFITVWEELLNVRPIGIRDNFFDLGGHSLLAVRMTARIERLCGRTLPVAALFAGATIEQLSEVLLRTPEVRLTEPPLVQVQAGGSKRPFFFLHGDVLGGGFYCSTLAREIGADQPFYALQPHGVGGQQLPETIEAMAADHLKLLRSVQPAGPYLLGGYCNNALVAFEMARQVKAQGQRVDLLVLLAPRLPKKLPGVRPLEPLPDFATLEAFNQRLTAMRVLVNAGRDYSPRPYPGRLAVILPGEGQNELGDSSRWKALAETVEVHVVPGEHKTMLTIGLPAVAARLRLELHKAHAEGSLRPGLPGKQG
jgi:thioesterase domain-containing protein